VGLDPGAVTRAVQRGDLASLLRAFGCQVNGHDEEWRREVDGLKLAMVAIILGWRRDDRDPIRLPSGFRSARLEWSRLTGEEQRRIAKRQVDRYDLPPLRPPPQPAAAGSG
jgi:hypothetical protein